MDKKIEADSLPSGRPSKQEPITPNMRTASDDIVADAAQNSKPQMQTLDDSYLPDLAGKIKKVDADIIGDATHRILMPDNSVFVFDEKYDVEPKPAGELPAKQALIAEPISSTSETIVADAAQNNKPQMQTWDDSYCLLRKETIP